MHHATRVSARRIAVTDLGMRHVRLCSRICSAWLMWRTMFKSRLSIGFVAGERRPSLVASGKKKADVVEHPEVFDHVGLLVDGPPGGTGLPFV